MSPRIRLVVVDIDGCLIAGEARPWDFDALAFVAQQNRRARRDPRAFAVTLCTGRQEPYVEAVLQAIDGFMPAIYENGGGLYFPSPYRFVEHPAITAAVRSALQEIRRVLRETVVRDGLAQMQPGKEVSVTLYPARPDVSLAQVAEAARQALNGKVAGFAVFASVSSVEILADGIDKGAGVEWLARETGIALSEMGGIGDGPGDLAFMRRVGCSAAPANAAETVRREAQYVSSLEDSRAVVDILTRWSRASQEGGD